MGSQDNAELSEYYRHTIIVPPQFSQLNSMLGSRKRQITAVIGIPWSISRQQNTGHATECSVCADYVQYRENSTPIATHGRQPICLVAYISRAREIRLLAVPSVSRDMQLIQISKPSLRMKSCLHGMIRSCIVSSPSKDRVSSPIPCVRIAWHTIVPTPSKIHI